MACYCLALAFDWPEWINGANWEWLWRAPQLLAQRWGWLAALALAIGLTWWWVGRKEVWNGRNLTILLLWVGMLTPAAQLIFASLHSPQPLMVQVSMESGFYQEGVRLEEPLEFAQVHLQEMPKYRDVHLRTQPPGWILTYWATARLWERFPAAADSVGMWLLRYDCLDFELQGLSTAQLAAGSLPILLMLLTGLGVLPFYGLASRFLGERQARRALLLYPLWPGLLVFTGRFDTIYAVLALGALWLAQATLTGQFRGDPLTRRMKWAILLIFGALLAGGTWFGFGIFAIVLLINSSLLTQVVLGTVERRLGLLRIVQLNASFGGFLMMLWGGLWLFLGINGLEMFLVSQRLHTKYRLSYPVWPLFNLYDLAVFMGMILLIGSFVAAGLAVLRRKTWQGGDALALGWVTAVLLLNLSGQVRAETGRLWLLLMGPGLLAGLSGWQRLLHGKKWWETAVFATFCGQAVVTALFLGGRMGEPSVVPPLWAMPDEAIPLNYQLGDTLALRGYTLRQDDEGIYAMLYWEALDFPRAEYSVLTHLVDGDGDILTQNDGPPRNNELPTWCWIPGEIVPDERTLSLAESGERPYQILVGMYDWRTGERLPVTPPVADNAIPISVPLELFP